MRTGGVDRLRPCACLVNFSRRICPSVKPKVLGFGVDDVGPLATCWASEHGGIVAPYACCCAGASARHVLSGLIPDPIDGTGPNPGTRGARQQMTGSTATLTEAHLPKPEGLEGVVAASTALSHVFGEEGRLVYRGYDIHELANNATFEEVAYLLWVGHLPTQSELVEIPGQAGCQPRPSGRRDRSSAADARDRATDGCSAHRNFVRWATAAGCVHRNPGPRSGDDAVGACSRRCWRPSSACGRDSSR